MEEADRGVERVADSACADEAHHRRSANVDFESEERVGDQTGQGDGQHGEDPEPEGFRARGFEGPGRFWVGLGADLCEQPPENSERVRSNGEHAGQHTGSDPHDEEQRPYDLGKCPKGLVQWRSTTGG